MAEHQTEPLTFISGNSKSQAAQEAIRVHVMRRQHRHRKQRKQQQEGKTKSPPRDRDAAFDVWVPSDSSGSRLTASTSQYSPIEKPKPLENNWPAENVPDLTNEGITLPSFHCLGNLASHASNPNSDKKDRSPESTLVQYYLDYVGTNKLSHELYRIYCHNLATYSAFLAVAATNYAEEMGIPAPIDPVELENLALREISTQLSGSVAGPPQSTMLAVAALADLREFRNEHDKVQLHWDALHRMIVINGGIESLRKTRNLYNLLFWIEGAVLSNVTLSIGRSSECIDSHFDPAIEVLQFFEDINTSATKFQKSSSKPFHCLTQPAIAVMSRGVYKENPYSLTKWRQAKLGCLIFLAVIALQSDSPMQKSLIYRAVESEVLDRERRYPMFPEEMYYVLVQICNEDHTFMLTSKVARLTNAIKRLEQRDRHTCYSLLCAYLGYSDPFAKEMVAQDWSDLSGRLFSGY